MNRLEFACRLRYPSGFTLDAAFASDAAVTALFGPSGSGKTSILSVLAGLRRPDQGRITLNGRVLLDTDAHLCLPPERRRLGYVFQDHLLFPHRSVRDNLLYGWRRRPRDAKPRPFERTVHLLELDGLLNRLPYTLSGGQRQRVALGRALLTGPELLLLDEPMASVDEALKGRLLDLLEEVLHEERVPALLVTHDPGDVRRLAQWVVRIESGAVQAVGLPADLIHALGGPKPS